MMTTLGLNKPIERWLLLYKAIDGAMREETFKDRGAAEVYAKVLEKQGKRTRIVRARIEQIEKGGTDQ